MTEKIPSNSPKCPRCAALVTGAPDELGFLKCQACGARLRKAPSIKVRIQSPTPTSGSGPIPAAAAPPPALTGNRDTDSKDSLLARIEKVDVSATLPPGRQSAEVLRAAGYAPPSPPAPAPLADDLVGIKGALEGILKELASLRERQGELEAMVKQGRPVESTASTQPPGIPPSPPPKAGARAPAPPRRPVLILDDDPSAAEEAREVLAGLGLTPTVAKTVREALDAMAREKPLLVVFEPEVGGELSGGDFVNYVKSTMDWIEIPILVHTRAAIENADQARTDFGADDHVIKGEGAKDGLAEKAARLTSRS